LRGWDVSDLVSGVALALLSAITTAISHNALKAGEDKLAIRAIASCCAFVIFLPIALVVGAPASNVLPWLAARAIVLWAYQAVLMRSYATSDLSAAFPVARGVVPLVTTLAGVVLLGDSLGPTALFGITLICAGVLSLASGRSMSTHGLQMAVLAGALTATYTVLDAKGIRVGSSPIVFIAWAFVIDSLLMPPVFAYKNRGRIVEVLRRDARTGIFAGVTMIISFGAALFALGLAPVGLVSALRETSVMFGMVFAAVVLREVVTMRRKIGALLVVVGATVTILAA
jgi:drug/metabolite transporter (DMT)-like permease